MASVKITGLKGAQDRIKKEFERIRRDPELLTDIAITCKEDMINNARAGRGPDGKQFKPITRRWYDRRNSLLKNNTPGEMFLFSMRSNLTFTGELLSRGIKAFIYPTRAFIEIKADGKHSGYRTSKGVTKSVDNSKIIDGNAKNGRKFLYVREALKRRINVLTKRFIRRLISNKKY